MTLRHIVEKGTASDDPLNDPHSLGSTGRSKILPPIVTVAVLPGRCGGRR